ncbi:hypothetical protein Hanom_Chr16g01437651 [Helianthus anomalus]
MASLSRIVAKDCNFRSSNAVVHRPRCDFPARTITNHVSFGKRVSCFSGDGKGCLAIQSKRLCSGVVQSLDYRYLFGLCLGIGI